MDTQEKTLLMWGWNSRRWKPHPIPAYNQVIYRAGSQVTLYNTTGVREHTFEGGWGYITYEGDQITAMPNTLRGTPIGEVYMPDTVTTISNYAFNNCSLLRTSPLPVNLRSLGTASFRGCDKLTLSELPDTLRTILPAAFDGCSSITVSALPEGLTTLREQAFRGCSLITISSLPAALTSVSSDTFDGCSSIPSMHLPPNLVTINARAFRDCASMRTINLDNVTSVRTASLAGCASLELSSLPETLISIGGSAFRGCSSITLSKLPDGIGDAVSGTHVPTVAQLAFRECVNITVSTVSGSVRSIQVNAFNRCYSITGFTCPPALVSLNARSFEAAGLRWFIVQAPAMSLFDNTVFGSDYGICRDLRDVYVNWKRGEVAGAPWGADNVTIHYRNGNYLWKSTPEYVSGMNLWIDSGSWGATTWSNKMPGGGDLLVHDHNSGTRNGKAIVAGTTPVDVRSSANVLGTDSFTVEAVVSLSGVPGSVGTRYLMVTGTSSSDTGRIGAYFNNSNQLILSAVDANGVDVAADMDPGIGMSGGANVQYISFGYDATAGRLWKKVNNTLVEKTGVTFSCTVDGFRLGNSMDNDLFFRGGIYSFRVYRSALSESDIRSNYAADRAAFFPERVDYPLPAGYSYVSYLGADGTQYIDTGVTYDPAHAYRVITTPQWTQATSSPQGCGWDAGGQFGINAAGMLYNGSTVATGVNMVGKTTHLDFTIEQGTSSDSVLAYAVDTVGSISRTHGSLSTYAGEDGYMLFACASGGTVKYHCRLRLMYAQIDVDGIPVRKMVPCSRDYDGELGMYDLLNSVFYPNAGSGVFLIDRPYGTQMVYYAAEQITPYVSDNVASHVFDSATGRGVITYSQVYNELPATFRGTAVTKVILPYTITSIGAQAFRDCTSLTEIDMPDSVTTIGVSAFNGCTALNMSSLPSGLRALGSSAFQACSSLSLTSLPSGLSGTIPSQCFDGCTSLALTSLPYGITSIGSYAFRGCALNMSSLPDTIKSLGNYAFDGCAGLTVSKMPSVLNSIGSYTFRGCGMASVNMSDALTTVGGYAFASCAALGSVTFASTLASTALGSSAFYQCENLLVINVPWSEDAVEGAPWGAVNATVNYDYIPPTP